MARAKKASETSAAASPLPRKKKTAVTPPVEAPASAPTAAAASPAPATPPAPVTPEERHRMVAEAAYYIALRKGFNSDPRENWLQAEAEIDAKLKAEGRL